MGIFKVRTLVSETGFRFYRIKLSGRVTTISIDPVLAEQLEAIFGDRPSVRSWLNKTANQVDAVLMVSSLDHGKKMAGLSRLVAREAWRLVLDPDHEHIHELSKIGKIHPLALALDK